MTRHPSKSGEMHPDDLGQPSKPRGGCTPSAGESGGSDACAATTASGSPCLAAAQAGSEFCYFHDPAKAAEREVARRAGGHQRSRPAAVLDAGTPAKDLKTVGDVKGLLSETIHQVRTGAIDPKVANCVGYLSGILLKAIEVGEIEERLAAMEAVVSKSPRTGYAGDFDRPLPGEDEDTTEHKEDAA